MEDILLATTSIIQGYEIIKYNGLVTSRATVGTGLFNDFFASISDITGGSSKTYNKELERLNNEIINSIKYEANKARANAVIGIKIDYDEISGKGKQMFMVTITGTVVVIKSRVETLLEDIIDEKRAFGEVENLKLRALKINRILNDVDIDFFNIGSKEKLVEFYTINEQYKEAENTLCEIIKKNELFNGKEKLIELYKISKQYGKAEDMLQKLFINSKTIYAKNKVNKDLFELYKISGQYAKAEDVLYEMIQHTKDFEVEKYKGILEHGIRFYEELLNNNDEQLEKGNLPRNEVYDGLNKLKSKL